MVCQARIFIFARALSGSLERGLLTIFHLLSRLMCFLFAATFTLHHFHQVPSVSVNCCYGLLAGNCIRGQSELLLCCDTV